MNPPVDQPIRQTRFSIQANTPEDVRQEILAYLEREAAHHHHLAERTGSSDLRAMSLACERVMIRAYETWSTTVIEPKDP